MGTNKKRARESNATIVFLDESGITHRPSVRRTWSPRGVTPVIRHRFNWERLNTIGVIACKPDGSKPKLFMHMQRTSIKKESIVVFIDALHMEISGRVVLLWDGLPAHRSLVVKDHIERNKDWLTVERLPAYAPELNPVEYVWSAVKGKDVANLCSDNLSEIEAKLHQARERMNDSSSILHGCLRASTLFK